MRRFLIIVLMLFAALPAFAVQPDEMLNDPVLEARARAISAELRCLVCQNQSIDDSDADLARDLRILLRARLTKGDTDQQVLDYLVDRYGEFVLLKPRLEGRTLILWSLPFVVLALAAIALVRRRRPLSATAESPLSEAERASLGNLDA